MANSTPALSRHPIAFWTFAFAGLVFGTLGTSACKDPSITGSLGAPEASLDGQAPNTANPCEVDIDFGNVPIGLSTSATVLIKNVGSSALDLSEVNPTLDPELSLDYGQQRPIPSGAAGQFTVSFQPYKVGQVQSSFSIQTDGQNPRCPAAASAAGGAVVTVNLTGNGIQLSLVVQPSVLDFGDTLINTTVTKSVSLINRSTASVTGIGAMLAGGDEKLFTVIDAPASLEAGASAVVHISYSPIAIEVRSLATATFEGSDKETATLALFGEPLGVALSLAPNPINFGYVPLLTIATACTVVTNQANVTVDIQAVVNFDTEDNAFAVAATDDATPPNPVSLPLAIAGGESKKVCFTLSPPTSQAFNTQAQLQTDDPSGVNPIVQLIGWGGGPQISCAPTSVAFGETLTHSTSTVPVICTNIGTALTPPVNLMLTPPTASPGVFSAQFDDTTDAYPLGGLAPGRSAQIDVSYSPVNNATDKGALFLKSNGGQGKTLQIPLSGQGLNVAPCQFVVSPAQLNFANVASGDTSAVLSFGIENVGADICLVQGLKIRNDSTGAFHLLSTSIEADPVTNRITIPAAAPGSVSSLTVSLDFAPTSQGAFSAEAAFSISDPTDPNQVVPLIGTSETSCLVIAPPTINFGDVGESDAGILCTSASRTFSIFNECQQTATVHSLTVQSGPGDLFPQFSVPAGPTLPLTIQPGSSAAIYEMFFEPDTLGTHTAQLLVSDGTVATLLPLSGAAVSTGTETDSFMVGPPRADILFIQDVDDENYLWPGEDEQAVIFASAPTFFAAAANIDFRVAVTTDNDYALDPSAEFGRLVPCPTCSLPGAIPTIVSPSSTPAGSNTPDPTAVFQTLWNAVNASAYPLGNPIDEHFFTALYNALQHGPQPGVDFFRPGVFFAALTDNGDNEPDASIYAQGNHNPTWYANFFETYFQNPYLFTWNYINPTQTINGTGFSDYLELPPSIQQMISASNGFALNTADPQWANALTSIWTSAISAHTYYPLVGSPSEGQHGIVVTVNGIQINEFAGGHEANWTYLPSINAISFNPNTDPPKVGAWVSITYPIGCK